MVRLRALVKNANTAKPKILQTRFTAKPMHYGAICNSGTTCATDLTADRQMADFFGFGLAQNGGLRIVYNDTTNQYDGAGLFATRQLAGQTVLGTNLDGKPASDPVADQAGDAQFPHYSALGVGPNLAHLDVTRLRVSNPTPTTLRFQISVADLSQSTPPLGKTTPLWLVRFQALGPITTGPQERLPRLLRLHAEDGGYRAAVLRRRRSLPDDDSEQLQALSVPWRHSHRGLDQREHDHDRRAA